MRTTAEKMGNGFTYSDYLTWPEGERWEIIEGEAFAMTPAPSIRHQNISIYLLVALGQFLRGTGCRLFHAPTDVVLDDRNVVQPDILVICDQQKITEKNINGAPDLVIEILSPSTALKDKRDKLALYERFQVREYLIVYPVEEFVERFLLSDGRYGKADIFGWDEQVPLAIFPEFSLKLWELFEKKPPQPVEPSL